MAYSRNLPKMTVLWQYGINILLDIDTIKDYQRLSWTIMDYLGLSWTLLVLKLLSQLKKN